MNEIDVLSVFCGPDGRHGERLGVVREGAPFPGPAARTARAAELGFGRTVFVDDPERGRLGVHAPGPQPDFAGHPLVGTAWLLDVEVLELEAGDVITRQDGEFTWITAPARWAPRQELGRLASPADVDALACPPPGAAPLYVWAWEDEAAGRVRARGFPRARTAGAAGAAEMEDEASGSGALRLTAALGRALNITQGRGSQLLTAPAPDGMIELGGRVRFAQ
ncbi:PhzF family phenazine biosynthesis protein [Streptomyces sp. NBC_00388]|uniref:PhzF family phenazine biosynthesis protein n=1 Tax=Streptomyces sp. NBC_00388 TaxID=2975735 RepID=UPI002E1ECB5B